MNTASSIVVGLSIFTSIAASSAAQPGAAEESPVSVRLIGETDALVPGQTFHLGVDFEIAEGWHLYWKNPGESGAVARIALEMPDWLSAGETQWPTPERLVLPGDILDYVHNGSLTLIVPVTVAADAPVGASAEIKADLWWLMCDDGVCVPGTANETLTLRVASEAKPSREARRFELARKTHPAEPTTDEVSTVWSDGRLTLTAPGAASVTFFPDPAPSPTPVDMVNAGTAEGDSITIGFDDKPTASVTGTLEARDASNKARFWRVVVPPPGGVAAPKP